MKRSQLKASPERPEHAWNAPRGFMFIYGSSQGESLTVGAEF